MKELNAKDTKVNLHSIMNSPLAFVPFMSPKHLPKELAADKVTDLGIVINDLVRR